MSLNVKAKEPPAEPFSLLSSLSSVLFSLQISAGMQNGALRRDSKTNEIGLRACFVNTAKTCIYVIAAVSAVISAFHLSC